MTRHSLTVSPEEAGVRVDRYLTGVMPGQSRSQVQRLIKEGKVCIAGEAVRANRAVKAREIIDIEIPEPVSASPQPEQLDVVPCDAANPFRLQGAVF